MSTSAIAAHEGVDAIDDSSQFGWVIHTRRRGCLRAYSHLIHSSRTLVFRFFNGALALAALAGLWWVLSLPSKAECLASGRVVDPTERHCQSSAGYQQLEEHAWFHSREVLLGVALLWVIVYVLHRRYGRGSPMRASAAGTRQSG